jgi:hypothetical protein
LISLAGILPAGVVKAASPLLTLQVLGSTTGQAGSYVSDLTSSNLQAGAQISFEVVIQTAPVGTTNGTKSINGTTDSVNALTSFSVTDGNGTFLTDTLASAFNSPPSASPGTIGTGSGNSISNIITSAGAGNYISIDGQGAVVLTGTFDVGSDPTESIAAVLSGTTNGTAKFSGSLTSLLESNSSGYVGFSPLTVRATPEPTSLGLLVLGVPAILARRRR